MNGVFEIGALGLKVMRPEVHAFRPHHARQMPGRASPSGVGHSFTIIQVDARFTEWDDEKTLDGSAKYELSQRIAGIQIVVFRGRDTAGGRSILLHQLTAGNDHTEVLKRVAQYLLRKPATAGGRILDLVDIQGAPFVVTVDEPECLAIREWLEWELGAGQTAPSTPAAPNQQPGEFTKLFQKPGAQAAPAAPVPAMAEQKPAGTQPGEFTRLFHGTGEKTLPQGPVVAASERPEGPAPLASEGKQPGEFTRLFRSPLAAPSDAMIPALPPAAPSQNQPGEFTRIFGGGAAGVGGSSSVNSMAAPSSTGPLTESLEPKEATRRPAPASPAPGGPGEFTRVISRSSTNVPPPAPPTPSPALPAGTSTTPAAQPAVPVPPPVAMPPPAPVAPHVSMPVAVVQPSAPAPPHIPAPQVTMLPAPPPSAPTAPLKAFLVLFGILLLAAIALVTFVLVRR